MMERDAAADRRMADTPALLKYLPRILLYPLTGHAIGTLLLLTVLLWFGLQSVMGIAMLAIATPWVFQYAEGVIDSTAQGRATPPRFGGDMLFIGSMRALRPLIGVALVVAGYMLARPHGPAAQVAALAAGALLFPGFMLVLAVDGSPLSALNPLRLIPAIVAVGRAYLVACLILVAAAATVVFVIANQVALFAALLVSIYLWLMTFHLLGYLAFHRADKLGLAVKVPAPTDESRRMDEQNLRLAAVLRNIDAALEQKNLDAAGKALYADPAGPADARLFHEELFEQLQRRRNTALIHAQGQRLITQLIRDKRVARALDVAETCFDTHRDFATEQGAQAVVLAEAALQAKRDGLFERLVLDAPRRYGNDAAVVSLAFLNAKFCCERRRDDEQARAILKPLLGQTSHPQHRQILAYARAISTPSASPPGPA
jgi:hypothetical protein